MGKSIEERLQDLERIVEIQSSHGNWDWDAYRFGMANGLILALHIMREDEGDPPYKSRPREWGVTRQEKLQSQGKLPEPIKPKDLAPNSEEAMKRRNQARKARLWQKWGKIAQETLSQQQLGKDTQ